MSRKSKNRKQHSEETKELARARVAAGESLSRVAREMGVAKSTLHSWLTQADRDGHQEAREKQKQRFIRQAWETIFKAVTVGDKRLGFVLENADTLDQAVKAITCSSLSNTDKTQVLKVLASLANVPLRDLAIYIGTVYDKIALAAGDPTSRSEEKKTVEDVTLKEVLKNAGTERTEIIRVIRNAAFTGNKDNSGNGSADLGFAIQNYRR